MQPDEQSRLVTPDMVCMYPMSAGGTPQMMQETPMTSGETTLIAEQKPFIAHELKGRNGFISAETQKLSGRR